MSEFLGLLGGFTQLLGAAEGATGGGLPTLLAQLENAGLGEHVQSWIGNNSNMLVSAEQLATAIAPDQVQAWSARLGMPPDELLKTLAHHLPEAVNQATPEGRLPDQT